MSNEYMNAAIDLARQLGAAERDVENLKRENAALRQRDVAPYNIESKEDLEKSELWRMQQVAISVMCGSNIRASFQANRLQPDNEYRTAALGHVEVAIAREITLIEKLRVAESALYKLARLGNGVELGNSTGNCMAQEALTRINLIKFEV